MPEYDFYCSGTTVHFARMNMSLEQAVQYAKRYNLWFERIVEGEWE